MKVDVFSLGATVWEMAQAQPPFSDVEDIRDIADEWPPLDAPDEYTHAFHDFLRLCSMPAPSRPNPKDLIHVSHFNHLRRDMAETMYVRHLSFAVRFRA
jgi:serine/threonine-protein kinase CLA4